HKNWKSKGAGRVQFDTIEAVIKANLLCSQGSLVFQNTHLSISPSYTEIIIRPIKAQNRIDACVLHVGVMVRDDCLSVVESWKDVKVEIMPERKKVEFLVVDGGGESYKLEFQFGDILASFGCCLNGEESNAVLLKFSYAPKIYRKNFGPTLESKFSTDRYHICKENYEFLWVRTAEFSRLKSIGRSSSICWELEKGSLPSDIGTTFPLWEGELGLLTLEELKGQYIESVTVPILNLPEDSRLAYEVIFQLNSLLHAQKISPSALNTELLEILGSLSVDSASTILQKMHGLKGTCYDLKSYVQSQLYNSRKQQISFTDRNLMSCHRVLVTPSKAYFMGPEIETCNYVVKHYAEYSSDFLRVSFVEEDWSKLQPDAISTSVEQGLFAKPRKTEIYHRILSILKDGIVIGTKRFEFLAFSASQLRSGSVWMFASNETVSAADIREWMGCFNQIRTVAKCAARMGQLFSSSQQTLTVLNREVEIIPDVEVATNWVKYCFSDGIGKISFAFAKQVAQKCGLSKTPSAFQIRYGGYKGVIAVDRNSFRKLSLRRSMLKFDSNNKMLNITKWSDSLPCYLNRDIISLLSTLGIKDEKFEAMQQEQIRLLNEMLTNREVAMGVLEGMNESDIKIILIKMLLQGFEISKEPYLLMMLRAHREYQLSDLRTKCRIFVPKGRVLIGCLDETGTLNYGQVYIRVTTRKAELQCGRSMYFQKIDDTTSVVVGKVVVTKNPCLHPGDIRVLEAIYEPELEEKGLIDCLVFPQKGERPHPNECSGGDLDGDIFFVSWDENLIPLETDAPMDYVGRRPRVMDHDVTLEEIQKFFVDYMINDTLGTISTAHLVHADREPEKARSPKCLQLATLHSMAVDFAKTGSPAEMPRALKPREYPDFMERVEKPMYISTGVLGKLYRATISRKENDDPDFMWTKELAEVAYDHDLEVKGFEDFLETAKNHKEMYIEKFSTLMNYYGAKNEDEILTGNLHNRSVALQRDKKRYGEMKDRILDSVKNLKKEAKGWLESDCKVDECMKMASAWYHVTYHPNYCEDTSTNFCSFPWILGDILFDIKALKSVDETKPEDRCNFVVKL
ncbi:hypothetical protein GIB67_014872, partial [Kingdonia uniflora]